MDRGLLPALCIAVTGCAFFLHLSRYHILQWPLGAVGHDPVVRDVLTILPAAVATILCFCLLRMILVVFGVEDIHDSIRKLLFLPFTGVIDTIGFGLAYTGLSQLFCFFGAHGPNLLFSVEENILTPAVLSNGAAISNGLTPHLIFTKAFFDVFTNHRSPKMEVWCPGWRHCCDGDIRHMEWYHLQSLLLWLSILE